MSRLDQLVDAAREGVRRRSAEVPGEQLRARLGTRSGSRPFKEALVRPGLSVIAEFKRGSPSAGAISARRRRRRPSSAPTSAAARRRSRCSPTSRNFHGSLADLEAARAATDAADPPQGLHRRPLPALGGVAGRRRRRPADRRRARRRGPAAALGRGRGARPRLPGRGPRRAAISSGRCELEPDVIGINNRNLADLVRRHRDDARS